jgi:hypothetical protein
MGLAEAGKTGRGFLPWAWALNGAFSVIATPMANLIATEAGFRFLLGGAAILYGIAWLTFPAMASVRQRMNVFWFFFSKKEPLSVSFLTSTRKR